MKDRKRNILEMRCACEEVKLQANAFLFRNTMNRFEDKNIKAVFLAIQYLNTVIETAINEQGINENDLSEDKRSEYLVMKEVCSLTGIIDDLTAALPDEDLSEGSE